MVFRILWSGDALQDLAAIDKAVARRIVDKVTQHLAQAPAELGLGLRGRLAGFYRYRVAKDWRVIYSISQHEVLIRVVRVGHRSKVYDE